MADDFGDKSEPPTPRRRMEARNRGQVPKSQELNAAVLLLGSLLTLEMFGGRLWKKMLAVMGRSLEGDLIPGVKANLALSKGIVGEMISGILPLFLSAFVIALVIQYSQVGWLLTTKPLEPSFTKLNPINGIKRIFSPQSLFQLVQNLAKLSLVLLVSWSAVAGIIDQVMLAHTVDIALLMGLACKLMYYLGIRIAIVLLMLALIDYVYQRYRHEKQLKMTKDEVKEEMKRMDGDPVIKRRRREIQLKLAAERMKEAVPKADVIVTNPTHYAIAIQYDESNMNAPTVVAKGVDFLALRIREIASAHGIPIVEKPFLARTLYKDVEVGDEIPERFYRAIAELLAYVYEIAGRQIGPAPVPTA